MKTNDVWSKSKLGAYTALIDWPPAPAPSAPPSLWEWVRAACVSRLGEPTDWWSHRWEIGNQMVFAQQLERNKWQCWRTPGGEAIECTTPAELTAALDRLAEEVGR